MTELTTDCVNPLLPNKDMNNIVFYQKYFNLIRVNHNDQVLFTDLTKKKNNI